MTALYDLDALLEDDLVDASHRWTAEEVDALPDDGLRREVLGGVLLMSPPPGFGHQDLLLTLYDQLRASAPTGHYVMVAPYRMWLPSGDWLEPDLVVAPREWFAEDGIRTPPLLVVEVASPRTARRDVGPKQQAYEQHGVPSYWLASPLVPELVVLELDDGGGYVERARVGAGGRWQTERPWPVAVTVRP